MNFEYFNFWIFALVGFLALAVYHFKNQHKQNELLENILKVQVVNAYCLNHSEECDDVLRGIEL